MESREMMLKDLKNTKSAILIYFDEDANCWANVIDKNLSWVDAYFILNESAQKILSSEIVKPSTNGKEDKDTKKEKHEFPPASFEEFIAFLRGK